ncbi:nucleoside deaminase [Virgibacillus sp. YIM 98842]|uniref:nucleoside deaminase n=1 Tax=Virgibacillus sp. YIM 98842 TaxID=2663533 RepID=UPI0013DA5B75|nr:nucleoside deaminase [Virgibacillus sp. YIM 98842]
MVGDEKLMERAVEIAQKSAMNDGGPFGAVIVKDGEIIGVGRNEVTAANDPTAHAEIQAIRNACQSLKSFQLTGCDIYTSCEPCPMCLSAIYWARPRAVYYAATKTEAAEVGFDDQFIYEQIALPFESRSIKMTQICPDNYDQPFQTWKTSAHKTEY